MLVLALAVWLHLHCPWPKYCFLATWSKHYKDGVHNTLLISILSQYHWHGLKNQDHALKKFLLYLCVNI